MKPSTLKIIIELIIVISFLLIAALIYDLKEEYGSKKEKPLLYTSQHTIASCNSNHCIDLLIDCNSTGHVTNIIPITVLMNMGENWTDTRNQIKWC